MAITYPITGNQNGLPIVFVEDGKIKPGQDVVIARTDAEGLFTLAREPDPTGNYYTVVVTHPDFQAEVGRSSFEAGQSITTRPWGRIEGVVRVGARPVPGAALSLYGDRLDTRDVPMLSISGRATADAEGRFAFDRVFPGDTRVTRAFGSGTFGASNGTLVTVRPGETARADVGGLGRPVVARIALPEGFDPKRDYVARSEFTIEADRPRIPYPPGILTKPDGSSTVWARQWWASAEGHAYRKAWCAVYQSRLQADRTILADDVPPGDYVLNLFFNPEQTHVEGGPADPAAFATIKFTIPELPGGRSDESFDLGVLKPVPRQFPGPVPKDESKPAAAVDRPVPR